MLQTYKPGFVCFGKIIVELKAVKAIAPEHEAQLLNYLKATGMRLGLLVNFGRCGGGTKDSINLDFFRGDRCVRWLKNWFPMDMQTAFGTVVCLQGDCATMGNLA